MIPYRTSNPKSVADAKLVIQATGIRSELVDISKMVDGYCEDNKIADPLRPWQCHGAYADELCSTIFLHGKKRSFIGTSNKTEILVGYGTQHGDLASAIIHWWSFKSQIWQLAEAIGVPKTSDRESTFSRSMGRTNRWKRNGRHLCQTRCIVIWDDWRTAFRWRISEDGIWPSLIKRIRVVIQKNQFKRRPPVIGKSFLPRTVNVDFRYVRDWGI